jgi:hypothetical protein
MTSCLSERGRKTCASGMRITDRCQCVPPDATPQLIASTNPRTSQPWAQVGARWLGRRVHGSRRCGTSGSNRIVPFCVFRHAAQPLTALDPRLKLGAHGLDQPPRLS